MADIPKEVIEKIRHSGYVHGVEDLREEIVKHKLVVNIQKLSKIVERLEK